MKTRVAVSMSLAVLTTMAGCHSWVPIRPTELPKLNGTSAQVQQPDGTPVDVVEPFDASVTMRSLLPLQFNHPVRSTVEGKDLVVQGANRGRTAFPLQEVTSVEVSQPDPVKTAVLASVFVGAAIGLLIRLIFVAAT